MLLNAKIQKKLVSSTYFDKKSAIFVRRIIKPMSKIHSFIYFLRNHKCAVAIVLCGLFVGVLDSNSVWERHYRWQTIDELKREIAQLEASYQENSRELEELRNSSKKVERIAREKYFMTRPGEDLFIIQSEVAPEGTVVSSKDDDGEDPAV